MWIIDYLQGFNPGAIAIRIALAMLFGGLIGLERGKLGRAAGMRTHILVCLGSTLTAMLGFFANQELGATGDPLRVAAQVVSGIGFLGVGTILIKGRFQITGLTTAACVWATATIGLALGIGFLEGAVLTFIAAFLTITIMHKLEYRLGKRQRRYGIYVEINTPNAIRSAIEYLENNFGASGIQVTAARSGLAGNIGIEANINNVKNRLPIAKLSCELEMLEYVVYAIESV